MAKSPSQAKCIGYAPEYECRNSALPNEAHCTYCKGRRFELEVCKVLRELGGKVSHNTNVDGSQCDIVAEFEQHLGPIAYYIECKAEAAPTGVNDVNQFYNAFITASRVRHFDKAMIVAKRGFTSDAKAKCFAVGIVCSSLEELKDRRADFHPYLKEVVTEYEGSIFYKKNTTSHCPRALRILRRSRPPILTTP